MAKELIINASLPEVRIALMEEGRIQELLIERASEKGIVGNIYKGRVTRVLPGMQAAFVDVGLEKAAFLYVDDIYVHPKVMGEEVEGHSDDDSYEEGEDAPVIRPVGTFQTGSKPVAHEPGEAFVGTTINPEASATSESDESIIDTSTIALHAAEHAEADLTADEVAQEFQKAAAEQLEDVLENESDHDEDESEDSDEESDEESGEDEDSEGEDDSEEAHSEEEIQAQDVNSEGQSTTEEGAAAPLKGLIQTGSQRTKRFRRGKNRRGGKKEVGTALGFTVNTESVVDPHLMPEALNESLADHGNVDSDRSSMEGEGSKRGAHGKNTAARPEFRESRNRDRRIKSKSARPRAPASIADLLKEGQEVIVQVAKDPIATKGARLTCHVSLPGRHLVCMPTIDHVGVSRRIERDDERRSLRNFVERNRPRKMGFIVRTASSGKDPEAWIKQDIDYLSKLWKEIRTRADDVSAPAVVYEDLNSVLRAIRDWVNEDIGKIIVDSRYHYNELMQFAERFMPQLAEIIELYQGDVPIFDAYGISSELHRSLERKVWLKSGGSIVIDQAEALVAIDVNTGRYVGKKSLEDTIFKTNLEAAEEIAHQLRLRNCGGIIIVDFIDMERDENRMRVYRALDEALKKDRARPTIQKISELGLVEMTRKRTRDTIIRTLCEPCTHCEGKGFTKSTRTVAYEIMREMERLGVDRDARKILVSAHEAVIDILAIDFREIVDSLERRYNKQVYLQAIMDFHAEQFEVVTDRMQGKKQTADIARQLRVERERAERKEKTKARQKEVIIPRGNQDFDGPHGEDEGISADSNNESRSDQNERPSRSDRHGRGEKTKPIPRSESDGPAASFAPARVTINPVIIPAGNATGVVITPSSNPRPQPAASMMEDEDQLAYLRAQATQDAALSSFGQGQNASPSVQNQGGGGGRNNPRHQQNPRNNNRGAAGGGRNDRNNRGGQGGGQGGQNRGRNHNPRHQGGQGSQQGGRGMQGGSPGNSGGGIIRPLGSPNQSIVSQTAAPVEQTTYSEPPQEVQVPDYEVLVKNDSDGSGNS